MLLTSMQQLTAISRIAAHPQAEVADGEEVLESGL
jgi:hypothetical protein